MRNQIFENIFDLKDYSGCHKYVPFARFANRSINET
jgi:hypothetical protein